MDVKEIFQGEHTKFVRAQKVSTTVGIGAFFKNKIPSCLGCW